MATPERIVAGRAFVRRLYTLTRLVSLYGLEHKQVSPQREAAWNELEKALAGEQKLRIVVAGEQLLMDGKPLKAGNAERSLAQVFNGAGMAGLSFSAGLAMDEFLLLVHVLARTKPAELLSELQRQFGSEARIRAVEFELREGPALPAQGNGDLAIAGHLAATLFGVPSGLPQTELDDPRKLLQAICAASAGGASAFPVARTEEDPPKLREEEVACVIHWLAGLENRLPVGDAATGSGPGEISPETKNALLETLAAAMDKANQGVQRPLLVTLAEHLAIRVALEKYERGEVPFNAVQQTLDSMKKEIAGLREAVNAREIALGRAGVTIEPLSEEIDRQFWTAIPERNKLQVLLSADAWCIPPKNIRSFVEALRCAGDGKSAQRVLKNYCHLLGGGEPGCAEKVAAGLAELADLYAAPDLALLEFAMTWVSDTLGPETAKDESEALSDALACLVKQAEVSGNYAVIHKALLNLERLDLSARGLSQQLRGSIQLDDRAAVFVDRALQASDPELVEVLKRIPEAAAEQVAIRFSQSATRNECERLRLLAQELGPGARGHWQHLLLAGSDTQAVGVLGILTVLAGTMVEQALPVRLRRWSSCNQALAIHQIAASGAPDRGCLLMRLIDAFHPLVIPQALDEVGVRGCPDGAASMLLKMARGEGCASGAPYTQIKAIEAVGRLRLESAVPDLTELACAKSRWKSVYPRETRIAALQAILRMDQRLGSALVAKSGISEQELWLAPLTAGGQGWVRHRRYSRITVGGGLKASVVAGQEAFDLHLEKMSLGGGLGTAPIRAQAAAEAALEIRTGLRRLRLHALMREQSPSKIVFEIVSISMEDRSRLRSLLTAQSLGAARGAAAD